MNLNSQPLPIIQYIFTYVDHLTHFELRLVSKKFKNLIDSEIISGTAPRNFFECILTDNIYYFKNYHNILNKSIITINPEHNLKDYPKKFLDTSIKTFVINFCKYLPESKINKYLRPNQTNIFSQNLYLLFMTESNVYLGDAVNIERIIFFYKPYGLNIYYDILTYSSKYNHVHIFDKYVKNVDLGRLTYDAFNKNSYNLLKYMQDNNLLNYNLDIRIYNDVQLATLKLYVDNFKRTSLFIHNVKKIYYQNVLINNIDVVDYLLNMEPSLNKPTDLSINLFQYTITTFLTISWSLLLCKYLIKN